MAATILTSPELTPDELRALGRRVEALRLERGWSQRQLSRRSGIPNTRISKLEHGRATPKVAELRRLGEVFGVGLDHLVEGASREAAAETPFVKAARELESRGPADVLAALLVLARAATGAAPAAEVR